MFTAERRQLGARVRALREAKGLSQERLADEAELHRTYIGGVERGERNVSFDNIVRIARALGIKLNTLVDGIE
jgi:transcriptional regulator with XRE-family HTH domain